MQFHDFDALFGQVGTFVIYIKPLPVGTRPTYSCTPQQHCKVMQARPAISWLGYKPLKEVFLQPKFALFSILTWKYFSIQWIQNVLEKFFEKIYEYIEVTVN